MENTETQSNNQKPCRACIDFKSWIKTQRKNEKNESKGKNSNSLNLSDKDDFDQPVMYYIIKKLFFII